MAAFVRPDKATALREDAVVQGCQYLTFTIGGESFGIVIASIKEIIEYRAPTEVPMMPGYMRGIINLRGRVLPVIDLAVRFGRSRSSETRRSCIVILEVREHDEQHDIGVMVDAVSAVVEIADTDIEPPPAFGTNLRTGFISGMGKLDERFVILLDISKVLSLEELAMIDATGENPSHTDEVHSVRLAGPDSRQVRAS